MVSSSLCFYVEWECLSTCPVHFQGFILCDFDLSFLDLSLYNFMVKVSRKKRGVSLIQRYRQRLNDFGPSYIFHVYRIIFSYASWASDNLFKGSIQKLNFDTCPFMQYVWYNKMNDASLRCNSDTWFLSRTLGKCKLQQSWGFKHWELKPNQDHSSDYNPRELLFRFEFVITFPSILAPERCFLISFHDQ